MRTIKFRGARMSDGETIYGYYNVRGGDAYIDEWRVKPNTVAQLVGFDDNGEDVYEDDILISNDGEFDIGLSFVLYGDDGFITYGIGDDALGFTLKK